MRFDAFVRFVVDRPDVEVTLEGMEGLFHSSYHIIKFPDISLFFLIKAGDQDIFSMELLSGVNLLAVFLPRDGYHLLILAFSLVGEVDGEAFSDGAVFLVQFADTLVDGVSFLCSALLEYTCPDSLKSLFVALACPVVHGTLLCGLGIAVHKQCLAIHAVDCD